MKLIDDRLKRRFAIESLWHRLGLGDWAAAAIVLIAWGVALGWFGRSLVTQIAADPLKDWLPYVGLFILLGPATVIAGVFIVATGLLHDWDYFEVHELEGRLRARKRGFWPYRGQQWDVPLDKIETLGLMSQASPTGLQKLQLSVQFGDPSIRQLNMDCHIDGIDRREEALDLLLRLGRIVGCQWYYADAEVRKLAAQVRRDASPDLPFEPIPELSGDANYHANQTATSVAAPTPTVAAFSPARFAQAFNWWQVRVWEPGKRVELVRPQPHVAVYLVTTAIGAFVAGVIGFFVGVQILDQLLHPAITISLAILGGALIAGVGSIYGYAQRELLFDWDRQTLTMIYGKRTESIAFSDLQRFVLRGLKRSEKQGKNRPRKTKYACDLRLYAANREHPLLQSDLWSEDPDTPVDDLAPLAAGLATSLNIPWEWEEFRY